MCTAREMPSCDMANVTSGQPKFQLEMIETRKQPTTDQNTPNSSRLQKAPSRHRLQHPHPQGRTAASRHTLRGEPAAAAGLRAAPTHLWSRAAGRRERTAGAQGIPARPEPDQHRRRRAPSPSPAHSRTPAPLPQPVPRPHAQPTPARTAVQPVLLILLRLQWRPARHGPGRRRLQLGGHGREEEEEEKRRPRPPGPRSAPAAAWGEARARSARHGAGRAAAAGPGRAEDARLASRHRSFFASRGRWGQGQDGTGRDRTGPPAGAEAAPNPSATRSRRHKGAAQRDGQHACAGAGAHAPREPGERLSRGFAPRRAQLRAGRRRFLLSGGKNASRRQASGLTAARAASEQASEPPSAVAVAVTVQSFAEASARPGRISVWMTAAPSGRDLWAAAGGGEQGARCGATERRPERSSPRSALRKAGSCLRSVLCHGEVEATKEKGADLYADWLRSSNTIRPLQRQMGSFNESRYSNEEGTICVVVPGVMLEMSCPYRQSQLVSTYPYWRKINSNAVRANIKQTGWSEREKFACERRIIFSLANEDLNL